ncbi:diacylglycerol kinase [Paenarthrobacter sp. DKR-5]|uniref:diacylglycerol/lipid kinase family protein n=1 Tax=Paenarthrobacter sp. DKR-5 TaxID=2835535 RepID=UPI001BDC520A|nr:diacylglycerol kinase family protein [Paenarthrobacter sp. DKR-5]MBT1001744.1 diacylglycerol kinase [Paenarthrobacter sp. DKR-5]
MRRVRGGSGGLPGACEEVAGEVGERRSFDRITLIYNPRSKGPAATKSAQLAAALRVRLPGVPVTVLASASPEHGRALAREAAAGGRPLIVSVSGDGGYNEVVNGVLAAGNPFAVSAVHAAGNANDHRRCTRRMPMLEAIVAADVRRIDLLKLTVKQSGSEWSRYAHSYIGFGLTPSMALGLQRGNRGRLGEFLAALRTYGRLKPFTVTHSGGALSRLDSLIFANIPQMAKYFTLSNSAFPDDGRFEVIALPHAARRRILWFALHATAPGLGPQPSASSYRFFTTDALSCQIDGEVVELPGDADVLIECAPGALAMVG